VDKNRNNKRKIWYYRWGYQRVIRPNT